MVNRNHSPMTCLAELLFIARMENYWMVKQHGPSDSSPGVRVGIDLKACRRYFNFFQASGQRAKVEFRMEYERRAHRAGGDQLEDVLVARGIVVHVRHQIGRAHV